ncbi:MAG TPA: SCP2 sterol-binding domain-containing protein [Woeseiaceae bacterium]|nr:SCP2 sterol-binding domain-containing protein [Woeseiaceae bacterium]
MNALENLLRPVARLLNRNIAATTPARELCAQLDGTIAAVRVSDTGLAMYFHIHSDAVELRTSTDKDPDIAISGSLLTLLRTAQGGGEEAIRDGSLQLLGDAERAQAFQKLLGYARPDVEEELSSVIGDAAAHTVGRMSRGFGRWARDARKIMGANVREYLQEESRDVPTRYEVERFARRVGTLRDDVERFAARLDLLENSRSA